MSQLPTARIEERMKFEEDRHRRAAKRASQLTAALVRCEATHEAAAGPAGAPGAAIGGRPTEEAALDALVRDTVLCPDMYNNIVHDGGEGGAGEAHPRAPRLAGLGSRLEDYARHKAFLHFLASGTLLPPDAPCFFVAGPNGTPRAILTDEEYLGAAIGMCHDLARVGVVRASLAGTDPAAVPFVRGARDLVARVLEELLQFDFRNGPLRRKYDSTKYALKNLEAVLFQTDELSIAGATGGPGGGTGNGGHRAGEGGPTKKIKLAAPGTDDARAEGEVALPEEADASSIIPTKEIGAIRERTVRRDKLRESLIKACRDGQKAAKQAIFALHRGDAVRAAQLLDAVEKSVADDLMPIVREEPMLRHGSFAGVLEEYVEGKLFYVWLYGDGEPAAGADGAARPPEAVGKILNAEDLPLRLSMEDYLGGLADLTGEVGRFAVARGCARDKESVGRCLDTSRDVYLLLRMLGKLPRNVTKKVNMVGKTVEKLQRVFYEQSMLEMTGRREFASGVETVNFDRFVEDS